MKYASLFVLGAFLTLFGYWYLPVSFCNVFAVDDFWHGTNVGTHGFWGTQLNFYQSWEGSFTHTFLATIPHVFGGRYVPFAVNMLTLLLLIFAICLFVRTYCIGNRRDVFLLSVFLAAFYYVTTGCGAEIRFWVCGNGPYLFGVSTLLIFAACYHNLKEPTLARLVPLWALQLVIVGNKVTYIICLFACMIVHDIVYDSFSKKRLMLFYFPASLFSIINILAPGNYLRLSKNMQNTETFSLIEVLHLRFVNVAPMFFYTLLMPSLFPRNESSKLSKKFATTILLGSIVFFLMDSLCIYICFGDPGPQRTRVLPEIWFLVAGIAVHHVVVKRFNLEFMEKSTYVISVGFILCVLQLPIIEQVPPTMHYAQKAQERDFLVKSQFGSQVVQIPKLPPSHLIISYFANDIAWIKHIYLPYFHMGNCNACITHEDKE